MSLPLRRPCRRATRRVALPSLVLLLPVLLLLACAARGPAPPPDVVVVVIDTLRADRLGVYGAERGLTPHLDRLAGDGVRYARAYSQAPWTTPSVASMLTSRYPTELGILERPDRLGDRFETLAERLGAAGYATAAVISHDFISREWNFDQGFDHFDQSNIRGLAAVTSRDVTDDALALLDEMPSEGVPRFLFVHYFDVHYDYVEHARFPTSEPGYAGPVRSGMVFKELLGLRRDLDAADVRHLGDLYDSEVAYTDHHLGRLLDGLRSRGLYEPALVVITADHGEELMERSSLGHGATLFDEVIHVPLLVKRPHGAEAGTVVDEPVGLIDLYPTLLELLGLAVPEGLSGRSLVGFADWRGGAGGLAAPAPRPVFSETDWGHLRAVVEGRFKLIHPVPLDEPRPFFDLLRDPGERNDMFLHQAWHGVARDYQRLDRRLRAWGTWAEARAVDAEQVEVDEERRRQLEALGYLQ